MKIAILSDIHSNIYALNQVFSSIEKECIDTILVCGDLIGYYYWPSEVLRLLRSDPRVICIAGNHEVILSDIIAHPEKSEFYRKKYGSGYDFCFEQLEATEIQWLVELPVSLRLTLGGCKFYLSHGGVDSIDRYIYPDASIEQLNANLYDADFTIFGHTHYPFAHVAGDKILINPGSVGQPRDVGGLASYVVLDLSNLTIRFKRKSFDFQSVVAYAKAQDPGLPYLCNIMVR